MDPLAKHVAGRLKAQPAQGPHPDAALLSAFAENALPAAARGPLLQHLGACSDCREILFLALPESAEAQKILVLKPRRFRRWGLTWGATVAAVAIVAVFFAAEHLGRENRMAKMVAPAATPQTETPADIETETGAEKKTAAEMPPRELDQIRAAREAGLRKNAVALEEDESKPLPQAKHMTGKMQTPLVFDQSGEVHMPAAAHPANANGALVSRGRDNDRKKDKDERQREAAASIGVVMEPSASAGKAEDSAIAAAAPAAMRADQAAAAGQQVAGSAGTVSPASAPPGVNVPASSEMVEVEAAAPAIETRSPSTSLSKSKSNATKVGAKGRNFVAALPKWSLSAVGEVQRSLDHGRTWLPAQPVAGVLFRAVASVGQEVWAAGNGGALYHSSDAGLTWSRLTVKAGGKDVQDDITEIDFTDATRGHLRTSAGSDFTTSDAGQTWQIEMAR